MSSDEFHAPPNLDASKLDFSEFHPLDHSLLQCRGYPGGRRRHLDYRWQFQWKDNLRSWTKCRVGLHSPSQTWDMGGGEPEVTYVSCIACGKRLSESQPL